ncbi:MAG: flagellar hook-length control protein FliK [Rhodocyclaceae bacterium]|nr:flagellar hook-length control protein FliK [Rhodocyclaceae bacterium]MDZ4215251.1 flagellar hook-length control protein FliK [Rhodocyclaceae bacterium]
MTATTFTPANLQANAAIAQTKGSSAQGASSTDAADPGSAGAAANSFGALFQQLMGKQPPPGIKTGLLDAATELTQKVGAGETAGELDALLPFMEAMGLAQSLTPEAAPIMPAITAGEDAIEFGNKPLAGLRGEIEPPLGQAKTSRGIGVGLGEGKDEVGSGREFAAKLTAAIDSNKQSGQPTNMSNVVQQVIATASPSNAPATMTVSQPVGAAGWGQEVGQRIVWMANRSEGRAELVLNPPQMGRVEVSLTVSGDQATASFASANPVVREALESALPRLREALAEAGIQLGQAQVGAENARHSAQQEKNPDKFAAHPETSAGKSSIMASSDHDSATSALKVGRGLVDVFA